MLPVILLPRWLLTASGDIFWYHHSTSHLLVILLWCSSCILYTLLTRQAHIMYCATSSIYPPVHYPHKPELIQSLLLRLSIYVNDNVMSTYIRMLLSILSVLLSTIYTYVYPLYSTVKVCISSIIIIVVRYDYPD